MLALAPAEARTNALAARRRRAAGERRRDHLRRMPGFVEEARARRPDRRLCRPSPADAGSHRGMAAGIEVVAALPDPVGRVMERWQRPNGLWIERVATPLGVIGVIFESRPNVTADAGALCLKAGNAAILRGGSDSFRSSAAIQMALSKGLVAAGLPADAIQRVPTKDRAAVGEMLKGLGGQLDVIVPRGGKSLVARVQSRHGCRLRASGWHRACLCPMPRRIPTRRGRSSLNATMRRTGVCARGGDLLVDRAVADTLLKPLVGGADRRRPARSGADAATQATRLGGLDVAGPDRGFRLRVPRRDHRRQGGGRAGCRHRAYRALRLAPYRLDRDGRHCSRRALLNEVDSAIVVHNASTQFADGGEFGFGAEIGIPQAACMRGDLWASSNSAPSSTRSVATGRCGLEHRPPSADVSALACRCLRFPRYAPGLRIGLFGGSFNPPHAGHRLVALTALRRLKLDAVWWIVTPGNP